MTKLMTNLCTILEFSPSYGIIQELNTFSNWSNQIFERDNDTSQYLDGVNIKSELGYGFGILDETSLLTPFGSINFSEVFNRHYNAGARIKIGSNLRLELIGTQESNSTGISNQKIHLNGTMKW